MWTYRPADSTPQQHEKKAPSATAYPASARPRPSSVPYRAASETTGGQPGIRRDRIPAKQAQARFSAEPAQETARIGADPVRTQQKPPRRIRAACVLGCLYLLGLTVGALCSRVLSEPLLTYARYFAAIDLGLHTSGNAAMVFSAGFLSMFCQLTVVFVSGFCVLGAGLIPVTLMLKGAGAGVFTALLYQELGLPKGLLLQALVFWLPEVLSCLIALVLSTSALHVSLGLLRCCLGQSGTGLGAVSRRLVHRYLALCFASMLVCGLSVILTLIFGSLF